MATSVGSELPSGATREKRTYTPEEIEKIRAERKRNRVLGSASQRLNLLSGFEAAPVPPAQATSPVHSPRVAEIYPPDLPAPNTSEATPKELSEPSAQSPILPKQEPALPLPTPALPPVLPAHPHTHLPEPRATEQFQYPPLSSPTSSDPEPKTISSFDNITQLLNEVKWLNESQKQKNNVQTLSIILLAFLLSLSEGLFEHISYLLLFFTVHIGIEVVFQLMRSNQKNLPSDPSVEIGVVMWFGRAIGFILFAKSLFEHLCLFIFTFCICAGLFEFH